ncbi:MAG: hypothetical protein JWM14_2090 [Chitinophagaceae bacterium]|nr:hypothetical protein [Chitinophagaceae bacterium]
MSIIRHVVVTLITLISESNLIVEVRYVEPYEEEVPIPDHPSAKPFLKQGLVFQVKDILKNSEDYAIGTTIRVPHADWKRSFSQHKEFHANGPSKSYSVKTYNSSVPSMKDAEILFLQAFHTSYDLAAEHAFEWADRRKQIEDLIRMS